MLRRQLWFVGIVAAVMAGVANAQPVVQVIGAGSSAMYNMASYGAWKDLTGGTGLHYTIKGKCSGGTTNCGQLNDVRNAGIPVEGGNLSVVWDSAHTKVWAYLSVDSVVGNRAFFAQPRVQLQIDASTTTTQGPGQLITSSLWGADASLIPSDIYAVLQNHPITAGFTDIRPEDAKFAQTRIVSTYDPVAYNGLGYGTGPNTLIGTPVQSAFSTSQAHPIDFNIKGTDPFSGQAIPAYTTVSIGAAPIIFVINRTNPNGLGKAGSFTNITFTNAQHLFNGDECDSNQLHGTNPPADVPVTVVLREPLSGTMNTTEFCVFRTHKNSPNPSNSQEKNVNGGITNPLNTACTAGGGKRMRGIGTGEVVNSGLLPNADSIGYLFFSYGNVAPLAGTPNFGYLALNGVDPINAAYSNGQLPTCVNLSCPATPGSSFPNLRSGKYLAWSVLRSVTDSAGLANLHALVTAIQNNVNQTAPDFVPFAAINGDPGLKFYRSHYLQSGVAPNNGLSGQKESGGDVGGCIEPVGPAPGVLNCHQ